MGLLWPLPPVSRPHEVRALLLGIVGDHEDFFTLIRASVFETCRLGRGAINLK